MNDYTSQIVCISQQNATKASERAQQSSREEEERTNEQTSLNAIKRAKFFETIPQLFARWFDFSFISIMLSLSLSLFCHVVHPIDAHA